MPKSSQPAPDTDLFTVPIELTGERLDKVLQHLYPDLSRSRLQSWIKSGQVLMDGVVIDKPKQKVCGGESLDIETSMPEQMEWQAADIPLDIHYQDEHIIVINKPAGLVTHPAPGHWNDTLVNGLLHFEPSLAKLPRAGIVHRLDMDTTGLLVVARTPEAHLSLVEQLQARAFDREYKALAQGTLVAGDCIDMPIGRHPQNRKKMAVIWPPNSTAKEAVTHFRIAEKFDNFTLLDVKLETGRTHQIRVHLSWLKHPLVGDHVYGVKNWQPKAMTDSFAAVFNSFRRQALHAYKLGLRHPGSDQWMSWQAELPDDFVQLLEAIAQFDQDKNKARP